MQIFASRVEELAEVLTIGLRPQQAREARSHAKGCARIVMPRQLSALASLVVDLEAESGFQQRDVCQEGIDTLVTRQIHCQSSEVVYATHPNRQSARNSDHGH